MQAEIWGRQAETTANFLNRRPFVSPNTRWEFTLRGFDFSPFSGPLWRLAYWHREE